MDKAALTAFIEDYKKTGDCFGKTNPLTQWAQEEANTHGLEFETALGLLSDVPKDDLLVLAWAMENADEPIAHFLTLVAFREYVYR